MAEYIPRETLLDHAEYDNNYRLIIPAEAIKAAPAADVAPVTHGRWIAAHDEFCSCSLCKYPVYAAWGKTNYCPNCGARMDGDADHETS